MHQVVKIVSASIGAIVLIIAIAISITINFIVTPSKLTPIVNEILKKSLNPNTELKRAELTIFSTFPNLAIEIDSLVVADTSAVTILTLDRAIISINPIAYLVSKAVNISEIRVISPVVTVLVDKHGKSNLDMFSISTDTLAADTTAFDLTSIVSTIDVKGIRIEGGDLRFDNRFQNSTFSSKDINLTLRGAFSDEDANMFLDLNTQSINATLEGERLLRGFPFAIVTDFSIDRRELTMKIDSARTVVGSMIFGTRGTLKADTLNKQLICDLKFGLGTPSLEELISYIPRTILKTDQQLTASGKVSLRGTIKGAYGLDVIPDITSTLKIEEGKLQFDSMQYGVQKLSTNILLNIDGKRSRRSSIDIKELNLVSDAGIDISVKSKITDIFGNYKINFDIDGDVNLSQVTEVFPLAEGITLEGSNISNLTGSLDKLSIDTKNYGNISLDGKSVFKDLTFIVDGSKVIDSTNSSYLYLVVKEGIFDFGNQSSTAKRTKGESNLSANIKFNQAGFRDRDGLSAYVEDVEVYAESGIQQDTSLVTPMKAELTLGDITITLPDTLAIKLASSKMSVAITPYPKDMRQALIDMYIRTDSLSAKALQNSITGTITLAGCTLKATPKLDSLNGYDYSGVVGFNGLSIKGKEGVGLLTMQRSKLGFEENKIILDGAPMRIGSSDLEVTGSVENLIATILNDPTKSVNGTLSIKSQRIDLNDILAKSASSLSKYSSSKESKTILDTIPEGNLEVLMIPKNINTNLTLHVKEVIVGEAIIKDIEGRASTKEGVIKLDNLGFFTAGSNMNISATYRPLSDTLATAYFDFNAKKIIIQELIGVLPAIDTLIPMLGSIEGVIDFNMVARSDINRSMSLDLHSLQSVVELEGKDLVLFDSETFKTVSKMLMFKNKKENIIDSLGLSAIIRKGGKIDVPPFEMAIDRYRAIVGGTQNLDFNTFDVHYKYNISIIKSPLPFKAGVDITGTNGDFEYDITKAKLKKSNFVEIKHEVDSIKQTLKPTR